MLESINHKYPNSDMDSGFVVGQPYYPTKKIVGLKRDFKLVLVLQVLLKSVVST